MFESSRSYDFEPQTTDDRTSLLVPVMSVGDWLLTIVLLAIPIVNIVLLIKWSMDAHVNPNRGNYAKALLIIVGIQILVIAMFFGMFVGMLGSFAEMLGHSYY